MDTALTIETDSNQQMQIQDGLITVVGKGSAKIKISGALSGIFSLLGEITANDGYSDLFADYHLDCFLAELKPISRFTRDLDVNGQVDAIELNFRADLNDNFTDFTGVVGGRQISATDLSTGSTPNDKTIIIKLAESGRSDTDITPDVEITACPKLMDKTEHVSVIFDNGTPVAAVDGAAPVLMSAVADDGTTSDIGIDADDSVIMTFSEIIQYVSILPEILIKLSHFPQGEVGSMARHQADLAVLASIKRN